MRINSETVLEGDKIVLVPYRKEHVPRLVVAGKRTWVGNVCVMNWLGTKSENQC